MDTEFVKNEEDCEDDRDEDSALPEMLVKQEYEFHSVNSEENAKTLMMNDSIHPGDNNQAAVSNNAGQKAATNKSFPYETRASLENRCKNPLNSYGTNDNTEQFIQCVNRSYPLWRNDCREYKKRATKEKCWYSIGQSMFPNWHQKSNAKRQEAVREMKSKWRHIRDNFIKYINASYADPTSRKRKYIYADSLAFLLPGIEKKIARTTIVRHEEPRETDSPEDSNQAAENTNQQLSPPEKTEIPFTTVHHAKPPHLSEELNLTEYDGDKAFLISLLPNIRKLSEEQKIDFRIYALQFFKNLPKEDEPQQRPSSSFNFHNQPSIGANSAQYPDKTQTF